MPPVELGRTRLDEKAPSKLPLSVFFTTVVRTAPLADGGELVKLDWKRKRVEARVPLFPGAPRVVEKNPRGNARGGRGIQCWNGSFVAGTYHTLYFFDRDLKLTGRLTHPLFVGVHELAVDGDLLWVTSTAIDGAIAIDERGELRESWWPRETPQLQSSLGLRPARIDKTQDNRLLWLGRKHLRDSGHVHLNAMAVEGDRLYALLNRFGVIYDVRKDRVVVEDHSIIGCHSLVFMNDRLLVLDSRARKIVIYSTGGRRLREIDLLRYHRIASIHASSMKESSSTTRSLFLRGLWPIDERRVLVGFSPATIVELDLEDETLKSLFQYSEDVRVCVHGLYSDGTT